MMAVGGELERLARFPHTPTCPRLIQHVKEDVSTLSLVPVHSLVCPLTYVVCSDLLVKVRYENPLPAPPFPPKLLDIPTSLARYGKPSYVTQLIRETPYPMMVDAECGMPLDLLAYKGLWDGSGTQRQSHHHSSELSRPSGGRQVSDIRVALR